MFRPIALAGFLLGLSLSAQPASVLHDQEDIASPGVIRLLGVTQADSVLLDGELVNAEGLARSRYNLLIAPGTYSLSITLGDSARTCTSEVTVRPGETAIARCARHQKDTSAD